jgi:hypothetical protein
MNTILNCFKKNRHDNYLNKFILPSLTDVFEEVEYISDLNHTDVYEKCEVLRKTYISELKKQGYSDLQENDVFDFFPVNVCEQMTLLGNYVSNLPYCKFLEKGYSDNHLVIKLNGESKNTELNFLSRILREKLKFKNVVLVFSVNRSEYLNFLELSYISYNNNNIYEYNYTWQELLQSAFTEMTLILAIEHAVWHLIVSHVIYVSKRSLYFTEILKVFNIAEKDVFIKSLQVKTLLFGTPLVFKQILNENEEFKEYLTRKISDFIDNFNIDTVFNEYFNVGNLDRTLNWIPGMNSNIVIIKDFVDRVVSKKDLKKENVRFSKYLSRKYDGLQLNNQPTIKKFLQILFVVGSAFHSTTFEFTKILMTDAFFNEKLDKIFYNISLQTIVTNIDTVFGDVDLYKGTVYKEEVEYLHESLETNRKNMQEHFEKESHRGFQNTIYTTQPNMLKKFVTNTFTTYV